MKNIIHIAVIALLVLLASCEKALMKSNPETSNEAIFNEYARLVKEKFSMLEFKGVDIDHLTNSIGATIDENLTDDQLFDKLAIITHHLRDAHSHLATDTNFASLNLTEGFDKAFDFNILNDNYLAGNTQISLLSDENKGTLKVVYGRIPNNNNIAYIWIPSWDIEIKDQQIEEIYKSVNSAKGLIFDIRQNTGGDPTLATKFASYLTDKKVYVGFERFKTGPDVNDFSDSKIYIQPTKNSNKFLKPVMVLTDRLSYSASTTFAYSVNPFDNITFIGQRTGGGSGSVADGYLANGWNWALSTSEFIDHLGNHLDDGVDPDITVALNTLDTTKDEIIERAIIELQKSFGKRQTNRSNDYKHL